jgi:hypothetical protein
MPLMQQGFRLAEWLLTMTQHRYSRYRLPRILLILVGKTRLGLTN